MGPSDWIAPCGMKECCWIELNHHCNRICFFPGGRTAIFWFNQYVSIFSSFGHVLKKIWALKYSSGPQWYITELKINKKIQVPEAIAWNLHCLSWWLVTTSDSCACIVWVRQGVACTKNSSKIGLGYCAVHYFAPCVFFFTLIIICTMCLFLFLYFNCYDFFSTPPPPPSPTSIQRTEHSC